MYANIIKVYEAVRELANKDQRGFVTPASFNKFAHQAQLTLFNKMFNEFEQARASTRRGISAKGDKSRTKRLEEDLSFYSTSETWDKTPRIQHSRRTISTTTWQESSASTQTELCCLAEPPGFLLHCV